MDEGSYCEKCSKECEEKGEPLAGKLESRLEKGLMEYRDPIGRKPVGYLNYLKKKNISVEIARGVAEEKGLDIEEHLVESDGKRGRPKKEESLTVSASVKGEKRGRPKKSPTKVEREEVVDLFASSIEEFTSAIEGVISSSSETSSLSGEEEEESLVNESEVILSQDTGKSSKKGSKKQVSDEEKEAKKLALEQEKEAKKQALEQEKEAKKQALEQEKEAKKQALEQEKEAKKQALEQEKEAKKLALEQEKEAKKQALEQEKEAKKQALIQEKLALEQEKEAKKQALIQEKEAKKQEKLALEQEKEAKKQEKLANKKAPKNQPNASNNSEKQSFNVAESIVEVVEERPKVQVSVFIFEGVKYWKSPDNIMYDPDTKEVKGIWSETEKKMLPAPEESDDELSEEEYEDDEDEE
jgi:hypothetical protein